MIARNHALRIWLGLALLAGLLGPLAACGRTANAPATATSLAATGAAAGSAAGTAAGTAMPATLLPGSQPAGTPPAATPGGSAARPTPRPPQTLTFTATDGVELAASYYAPAIAQPVAGQRAPGVLLLHMLGRARGDWDAFARALQANGMAALAVDLRGHGESGGTEDWENSPGDVRTAWDFMVAQDDVDFERSAMVGASIGANLALIVGANNPDVAAVIALSPGLDYHNLKPAGLLGNFGERPVLIVASQDDAYAYQSAQQMAPALAAGESFYYTNAGHGTAMFANPDLEQRLIAWLLKYVGEPKG